MEIQKYRILEWTIVFADGARTVEFETQALIATKPKKWETLGTSRTLPDARKALLFHSPNWLLA